MIKFTVVMVGPPSNRPSVLVAGTPGAGQFSIHKIEAASAASAVKQVNKTARWQ